jgi:hypothetical protein
VPRQKFPGQESVDAADRRFDLGRGGFAGAIGQDSPQIPTERPVQRRQNGDVPHGRFTPTAEPKSQCVADPTPGQLFLRS